jgi:hypothetical protein
MSLRTPRRPAAERTLRILRHSLDGATSYGVDIATRRTEAPSEYRACDLLGWYGNYHHARVIGMRAVDDVTGPGTLWLVEGESAGRSVHTS